MPSLFLDTSKLPKASVETRLSSVIVNVSMVFLVKVVFRKLEVALGFVSVSFIKFTNFTLFFTNVTPLGTIKSPPFS